MMTLHVVTAWSVKIADLGRQLLRLVADWCPHSACFLEYAGDEIALGLVDGTGLLLINRV